MSIENIRALRNAKPFEPFSLVMSDGRKVRVELPLRIAVSPTGKSVSVYESRAVETFMVADIRELELRPLPPQMRRFHHDV